MTKQEKIHFAVIASMGAVIVVLIAFQFHLSTRRVVNVTDEQVRQMIDKELPRGATRSAVRKFLASKGWPHSDVESTTLAMIRDAEHQFLIRKDIQVQFHFDQNDELASYDLKDYGTGP